MNIQLGKVQQLFKPYIVERKNGQCQILIPLIELDELCSKIESFFLVKSPTTERGAKIECLTEQCAHNKSDESGVRCGLSYIHLNDYGVCQRYKRREDVNE